MVVHGQMLRYFLFGIQEQLDGATRNKSIFTSIGKACKLFEKLGAASAPSVFFDASSLSPATDEHLSHNGAEGEMGNKQYIIKLLVTFNEFFLY